MKRRAKRANKIASRPSGASGKRPRMARRWRLLKIPLEAPPQANNTIFDFILHTKRYRYDVMKQGFSYKPGDPNTWYSSRIVGTAATIKTENPNQLRTSQRLVVGQLPLAVQSLSLSSKLSSGVGDDSSREAKHKN